MNYHTQQKAA